VLRFDVGKLSSFRLIAATIPEVRAVTDVLAKPVLVLNRHFSPIQMTTAKRGMILLYGGAAHALDEQGEPCDFEKWRALPVREEDDAIPIVGGALRVPRVLHLLRYDRTPRLAIRLTRKNLMIRDDYQCQYCQKKPLVRELNIDHVQPRSRGGPDTWENLVVACRICNLKKGWKTPEEANMRLLKKPVRPRWALTTHLVMSTQARFPEWEPFLEAG
jgi:5-methylcytosine-specific restriction endonuclease McrA